MEAKSTAHKAVMPAMVNASPATYRDWPRSLFNLGPIRQWLLTFPYPLRFLFAARPQVPSKVLGVVYRAISTCLINKTGFTVASGAKTGVAMVVLWVRVLNGLSASLEQPLIPQQGSLQPWFDAWKICMPGMDDDVSFHPSDHRRYKENGATFVDIPFVAEQPCGIAPARVPVR